MRNFVFNIRTKVHFGKNSIKKLSQELGKHGSKVMLIYGQSIKKNGVYLEVINSLEGFSITEYSGVCPNPEIETVRKALKIARSSAVDMILAVGGGSVIDCAKAVAAGYYYDDDPWDLVLSPGEIARALPVAVVLTTFGTGSEVNGNAVISNAAEMKKIGMYSAYLVPHVAVMDPAYTCSLPAKVTAAGIADGLSHGVESYFAKDEDAFVQDRIAEGVIKTYIQYGISALREPDNYAARANLMWAGAIGLSGLTTLGRTSAWSCHPIEHEISARYPLAHGEGMAILLPQWLRYIINDATGNKFAEYAGNVWHVPYDENRNKMANLAVEKMEKFFEAGKLPKRLKDVGIGAEHIEEMAEEAVKNGFLAFAYVPLNKQDVIEILKMCL